MESKGRKGRIYLADLWLGGNAAMASMFVELEPNLLMEDRFPQIWFRAGETGICDNCCGTGTAWCRVNPEQPANLTWGGKDLGALYIAATTSVYKPQTTTEGFLRY